LCHKITRHAARLDIPCNDPFIPLAIDRSLLIHDLLKDPEMLKRFKELHNIGAKELEHILFAIDSMLKNIKLKSL